ncbi:hypothetical protein GSI_06483 [Ganoderma sinense ZZ0214-1]|uniref:Integrase catalytic domain-containing protein n=1 Tax=Ganoderma sinense ZZ0214-1 TaxID=1077348 RepID=A0A2G8SDE1_9APHY|nr:hypothetical protein GSI_06483 [Ganoderma sinense ZZ0214-1]
MSKALNIQPTPLFIHPPHILPYLIYSPPFGPIGGTPELPRTLRSRTVLPPRSSPSVDHPVKVPPHPLALDPGFRHDLAVLHALTRANPPSPQSIFADPYRRRLTRTASLPKYRLNTPPLSPQSRKRSLSDPTLTLSPKLSRELNALRQATFASTQTSGPRSTRSSASTTGNMSQPGQQPGQQPGNNPQPQQQQNPQQQPAARGMPVRGERTCPTFAAEDPRGVWHYFEDLEQLFTRNNVANEELKKQYAVRYPPSAAEQAWRCLPSFVDQAADYTAFRDAVLKLYRGSSQTAVYTAADYDALSGKRARLGPVVSYDEYLAHYLEALPIITQLVRVGRISGQQAYCLLEIAVPHDILRRVEARLEALNPNLGLNDIYTVEQFHEAVCYIMQRSGHSLIGGLAIGARAADALTSLAAQMGAMAITPSAYNATTVYAAPQISAPLPLPPPPPPVKSEPDSAEVYKAILEGMSQLTRALTNQTQSNQRALPAYPQRGLTPPPQNRGMMGDRGPPRGGCFYYGNDGCSTRACPEIQEDIRLGKICRDIYGKIVLHSGAPIPNVPAGGLIRERVNLYYDTHPKEGTQPPAASQLALALEDWEDDTMPELEDLDDSDLDMFGLEERPSIPPGRGTWHMSHVEVPRAPYRKPAGLQPLSQVTITSLPTADKRTTPQRCAEMPVRERATSDSAVSDAGQQARIAEQTTHFVDDDVRAVKVHPYAAAKDASTATQPASLARDLASGTLRTAPPHKSREAAYKTAYPDLDPEAEERIVQRVLTSLQSVSLTPIELLSVAPGIRRKVHEMTTARRVPAAAQEPSSRAQVAAKKVAFATPEASIMIQATDEEPEPASAEAGVLDAVEAAEIEEAQILNLSAAGGKHLPAVATLESAGALPAGVLRVTADAAPSIPRGVVDGALAVVDRLKIRTIWGVFAGAEVVECILDGGCQFIAMSEECALRLKLPYDPSVTLRAVAANGSTDRVLGLARNVPLTLPGMITVHLQVYIIRNASYDVLLGRPFESFLSARIENRADAEQLVTVRCPNTNITVTIPTLEELVPDEDGLSAFVVEFDRETGEAAFVAYTPLPDEDSSSTAAAYLLSCDPVQISRPLYSVSPSFMRRHRVALSPAPEATTHQTHVDELNQNAQPSLSQRPSPSLLANLYSMYENPTQLTEEDTLPESAEILLSTKKKYKPVALKVKPLQTELPERFRIQRRIVGDPLADMPPLNPNPPPFVSGVRYTLERRAAMHEVHSPFLNPAELAVLDDLILKQELGLAWDDAERGRFRSDFFPPVEIPTVPHKPWALKNIPIPPGLYKEVCDIIRKKIESGVYEPSNSSYRSRWFCVLKKDGKSLRIVHSLEPLNTVTIQHSGVTPIPEQLAEQFAGRPCVGLLDLFVGYDEREIAESSHDLTTFQTPFGAHHLVTLPMGWSNSVPIFHDDVTFILQDEIPAHTVPYIDDVPIKGPESDYRQADGACETIPENPRVRRFVWEHLQVVNRIIQRVRFAGGTFSGKKFLACVEEGIVVGHRCTPVGRLPDLERVDKVLSWGPCRDLSDLRAFLGTIGVARIFIKDFAKLAHPLVNLTRKDVPYVWTVEQDRAMDLMKQRLIDSPALRAIDYDSEAPVIVSADTSWLAVGYLLCQQDPTRPSVRYYNRFGSITLNAREQRFSQPKLEIYGLYRALRALRLWIIGVRQLVVEVDARYIQGMLANPDIMPTASINRWIMAIHMFHFKLVHVPGERHAPDGLSRRPPQEGDVPPPEDGFDDWIDNLYAFTVDFLLPPRLGDAPFEDAPLPHIHALARAQAIEVLTLEARAEDGELSYDRFPRTEHARATDAQMNRVAEYLTTLQRPADVDDKAFRVFLGLALRFGLDAQGQLWKKVESGAHRKYLLPDKRAAALRDLHDHIGHRGFYATRSFVCEQFWWPDMRSDVLWFVRTCHLCQVRKTTHIIIPPTVAYPAAPMFRVHVDTASMPGKFKYLAHAHLLSRWGALSELISDNGKPWVAALKYLAEKYHVNHIRISGYNSRANGVVESPHHPTRDALYKATEGEAATWQTKLHSVLWADRASVRRRMGCSPYFAITGTHPVLPLDIVEATYLVPPPDSMLTTADLIARRAIALQKREEQVALLRSKVYAQRVADVKRLEDQHRATIRDFDFAKGRLVLLRNTAIEKSLNRKMRPRYLGPYVVITWNRGGAYILAELDGAVFDRPVAAFRVIPYQARTDALLIPGDLLDTDSRRIKELEESAELGEGAELFSDAAE